MYPPPLESLESPLPFFLSLVSIHAFLRSSSLSRHNRRLLTNGYFYSFSQYLNIALRSLVDQLRRLPPTHRPFSRSNRHRHPCRHVGQSTLFLHHGRGHGHLVRPCSFLLRWFHC